jgi:hypothetical protein
MSRRNSSSLNSHEHSNSQSHNSISRHRSSGKTLLDQKKNYVKTSTVNGIGMNGDSSLPRLE